MLFINRRGYANFVSCRSCGEAIKCPHCDVTLTLHRNGRMLCHYCGYSAAQPKVCPSCGSPYIAPFGTGTQKIEEMAAGDWDLTLFTCTLGGQARLTLRCTQVGA